MFQLLKTKVYFSYSEYSALGINSLKNVEFLWKDLNERNQIAETSLANVEVKILGASGDEKSFHHQHQFSPRAVLAQQQQQHNMNNSAASASPRANARNNIVFNELKEYNGPVVPQPATSVAAAAPPPPASAVHNSISNNNSNSNVSSYLSHIYSHVKSSAKVPDGEGIPQQLADMLCHSIH